MFPIHQTETDKMEAKFSFGIMQIAVHQYRWCHWFDFRCC